MRPIALVLFLAASLTAAAQSHVIYQSWVPSTHDNMLPSPEDSRAANDLFAEAWLVNTGSEVIAVSGWAATRFVPTSTFTLESITVPLITSGGVGQAEVDRRQSDLLWFGIYSDAGGAPGSALLRLTNPTSAQAGGLLPNPLPGSQFIASAPFTMTAGATYWIVMGPDWPAVSTSDGSTAWAWAAYRPPYGAGSGSMRSTALTPGAADWSPFTSDGWGPSTTIYADWEGGMSVTGSVIPEPSTYAAIAGIGALGLVLLRRRNVNTNSQNTQS